MENVQKKLGTITLGAALLAGASLLVPSAKADATAGAATYKAKCLNCHGPDGKGKDALKTKDFASADVQKMSDADLTAIITNGKPPKMPPNKTLTADQVKDLVAYVRSKK